MKKQKNQFRIVFAIIGLMILYIYFFPVSLTREVVMEPVWYKELATGDLTTQAETVRDPVVSFKVGRLFGYVDLKGRLRYIGDVLYDVTQAAFTRKFSYPRYQR